MAGMRPTVSIREILLPSDLSSASDRALEHAALLAGRFEAALTLYHAVEVHDLLYAHWAFDQGHEIWAQAEEAAQRLLEERASALKVRHKVLVERAVSAPRALLEVIRRLQPDLTVMATHGRGGLSHLLLGSVTEQVVRHAFRPVLCMREADHGDAFPYRRILVPTDLSPASRLAFPMGAQLARTFDAEVLAVHVTRPSGPGETPSEAWLWRFFQPDFGDLGVTAQVLTGSVWERIVHTARVEKADLVVMSTHGHDSLGDRILGSNTERVVRHSPCPVLVA